MSRFVDRMIGAAKLNVHTYEDVEADTTAMKQAMAVVILASLAAGVGSAGRAGFGVIIVAVIAALAGWYLWALLTYLIGAKLLPEPQTHADVGQLLRTIGFSSSPGLIRVLGIIPGLTGVVFFIAAIWMLVAMVVAVRAALDYQSTLRAIGVCLIGWVIQTAVLALVFFLFGGAPKPA